MDKKKIDIYIAVKFLEALKDNNKNIYVFETNLEESPKLGVIEWMESITKYAYSKCEILEVFSIDREIEKPFVDNGTCHKYTLEDFRQSIMREKISYGVKVKIGKRKVVKIGPYSEVKGNINTNINGNIAELDARHEAATDVIIKSGENHHVEIDSLLSNPNENSYQPYVKIYFIKNGTGYTFKITDQMRQEIESVNTSYDRPRFFITNENGFRYPSDVVKIEVLDKYLSTATEIELNNKGVSILWLDTIECVNIGDHGKIEKLPTIERGIARRGIIDLINNNSSKVTKNLKLSLIKEKEEKEEKKEKNMFGNLMKNVKFGKALGVKTSIYGPAFKSMGGTFISYDKKEKNYVDVTDLLLEGFDDFNYCVPVAKGQVQEGDYILHNDLWVRVLRVEKDKNLKVEKIFEKEITIITPLNNIFGFNFYTKLLVMSEGLFGNVDSDNPFGSLLPFLMMNDGESGSNDLLPMMMMMMNGGALGTGTGSTPGLDFSNPMVMMMMMKDGGSGSNSLLPMMMMMNGSFGATPTPTTKEEKEKENK